MTSPQKFLQNGANDGTDGEFVQVAGASVTGVLLAANNLSDVATRATALANILPSPTRAGDVLYWNGTSWVLLAGNNSGTQFLQETSSGVPSWATPAAGAMSLLNTLTASNSATLSDTSSLTSSFSEYEIAYENILAASGTAVSLNLRVHSGGSFQATSYVGAELVWSGSATGVSGSTTSVLLMDANVSSTGPGISGRVRVGNPSGTSNKKIFHGQSATADTTGANRGGVVSGYWNGGNGAVDGFEILFSSGNITSGTVKIYGIT